MYPRLTLFNSLGLALMLFFTNCTSKTPEKPLSFYHWKSQMQWNNQYSETLQALHVQRIYIRLFDVKWENNAPALVGSLHNFESVSYPKPLTWIPTIYIDHTVFKKTTEAEQQTLLDNIEARLRAYQKEMKLPHWTEIQWDCDWTQSSKVAYFSFLEKAAARLQVPFSATIRLHQVKYMHQTGVPPVDRGVLMFYNMGNLYDPKTQNSILDLKTAEAYLSQTAQAYPLKLDVALPLFSWGVVYRWNRPIRLLQPKEAANLKQDTFCTEIAPQQFRVLENHYLNNTLLYKNDEIRVESVTPERLTKSAHRLAEWFGDHPVEVIYYHLDESCINSYSYENLRLVHHILQ